MLIVKEIEEDDIDLISRIGLLEEATFSDAWSEKQILSTVEQKQSFCMSISEGDDLIGYFLCYHVLDECEIARIAIGEKYRRQGYGTILFDEMIKGCKKRKVERILLDVRKDNIPAVRFYKKSGFKVDGVRKGYYAGEHPQDAILMSLEIE